MIDEGAGLVPQTGRQTDRHTGRQTDRQEERKTDRSRSEVNSEYLSTIYVNATLRVSMSVKNNNNKLFHTI